MTNLSDFLQRLERLLIEKRTIDRLTCEAFADLPLESRVPYAAAMRFLGCESASVPPEISSGVEDVDRIRASRLMLLKLGLDGKDPRWSSWTLDRLLEAVTNVPCGCFEDLLHALYGVLGEYSTELTEPVRNFIRDMVVKCFTENRAQYEEADFAWMIGSTTKPATSAQAYFALYAIPPNVMNPRCSVSILRLLESTPYWAEAISSLGEDFESKEAHDLLSEWAAEGIASPCAKDVDRLLGLT